MEGAGSGWRFALVWEGLLSERNGPTLEISFGG